MIASVIMYQMICDKCEETLKYDGDQIAFEFQHEALQCAKESRWVEVNGEWYCPECADLYLDYDERTASYIRRS